MIQSNTPSQRSDLVPRPRLFHRLDEGLRPGHRLMLVSAPAGYGKSTLLSAWIQAHDLRAAWLSLDAGDNDPVRFLTYLIAAIQRVDENIGTELTQALRSAQPPPVDALLTPLINEIAGSSDDLIVVLDDYHEITDRTVHEALAFLLGHLPGNARLVIATRADPPLALARLRGRGALIRWCVITMRPWRPSSRPSPSPIQPRCFGPLRCGDMVSWGWASGLRAASSRIAGSNVQPTRIRSERRGKRGWGVNHGLLSGMGAL